MTIRAFRQEQSYMALDRIASMLSVEVPAAAANGISYEEIDRILFGRRPKADPVVRVIDLNEMPTRVFDELKEQARIFARLGREGGMTDLQIADELGVTVEQLYTELGSDWS